MNYIENDMRIRVNEAESNFLKEDVRSGKCVLTKSQDCETYGNGEMDIL